MTGGRGTIRKERHLLSVSHQSPSTKVLRILMPSMDHTGVREEKHERRARECFNLCLCLGTRGWERRKR